MANIQSAVLPRVVASTAIPITTPAGLDTAKAKEYTALVNKGLLGNILNKAIPIAIAANILCKDIVHKFFHASLFVPELISSTCYLYHVKSILLRSLIKLDEYII